MGLCGVYDANYFSFRPEFILCVCSLAGHERWADSAERMFDSASKDGQVFLWIVCKGGVVVWWSVSLLLDRLSRIRISASDLLTGLYYVGRQLADRVVNTVQ